MIILYGNRALLPDAPWQNDANRVPTGTKQHKAIPDLNVLCYMDILWMDLLYGIHCMMFPATIDVGG